MYQPVRLLRQYVAQHHDDQGVKAMPRAKSPRTAKPKAETAEKKVLQMPENGNGRNGFTPADLESEIRLRAYELYQQREPNAGSEQEDWLRAEQEVLARHQVHSQTA
jgi:Protein of unknown function (DUF2934)